MNASMSKRDYSDSYRNAALCAGTALSLLGCQTLPAKLDTFLAFHNIAIGHRAHAEFLKLR